MKVKYDKTPDIPKAKFKLIEQFYKVRPADSKRSLGEEFNITMLSQSVKTYG